jgi:hypothetical protein
MGETMKKLGFGLIGIVLLALPAPGYAQDSEPWPPENLFADSIEIVKSEFSIQPFADNGARLVRFYPDGTTQHEREFAFRDEFLSVEAIANSNDGLLMLGVLEEPGDDSSEPQAMPWILDTATGDYTRYIDRCDELPDELPAHALQKYTESIAVSYNRWIVYAVDAYLQRIVFCSTRTGELRTTFPNDGIFYGKLTSPNGAWLLLFVESPGYTGITYISSYEVATGKFNYLGQFESEELTYGSKWVDNTHFVFGNSEMPEWSTRSMYILDVTQPNSLGWISKTRFDPDYYDDPPRFEVVPQLVWEGPTSGCELIVYDILSQREQTYDTGICDWGLMVPGGHGARLYRYLRGENTPVTLVRVNPFTDEWTELYMGEIETIESISPDEHYVVLGMDTNGRIDIGQNTIWSSTPAAAYLAVVDLITGQTVYTQPTTISPIYSGGKLNWDNTTGLIVNENLYSTGAQNSTLWIDNRHLLITEYDPEVYQGLYTLIHLDETPIEKIPLEATVHLISPDHEWLLIQKYLENNRGMFYWYNVTTQAQVPLVPEYDTLTYAVEVEGIDNDLLSVVVFSVSEQFEYASRSAHYFVRVP